MKRALKIIGLICLYGGVIPILALITAYFSASVVVGHDYSHKETVGVISYRGFPIWFIEAAPGVSIMSGWHFERFQMNVGVWLLTLIAIAIAIHVWIKKRNRKLQPENGGGA